MGQQTVTSPSSSTRVAALCGLSPPRRSSCIRGPSKINRQKTKLTNLRRRKIVSLASKDGVESLSATPSSVMRDWLSSGASTEEAPLIAFDTDSGKLILMSCVTGLVTGSAVVGFEQTVHMLQHVVAEGICGAGNQSVTQFIRSQPPASSQLAVVLSPVAGALGVVTLRRLVGGWTEPLALAGNLLPESIIAARNAAREPAKLLAAAVSLGTGNSLGPEGPTVQFGKWLGEVLSVQVAQETFNKTLLQKSGAAAAVGAAFGAPLSGIFFALESASESENMNSIKRGVTVACVCLSSIVSSEFSAFLLGENERSAAIFVPQEVLLNSSEGITTSAAVLLGVACGLLSTAFYFSDKIATDAFQKAEFSGVPPWILTVFGAFICGSLSLVAPEIRFGGFDDLNIILGDPGFTSTVSYTSAILLQIVAIKLVATSICKGSGLVGGIYAPSIYLGGLLGLAYAEFLQFLPSADALADGSTDKIYAFVGMAAMLGGRCRIPLTSILLLLELTQNYDILTPAAASVGLSYYIATYLEQPLPASTEPENDEGSFISDTSPELNFITAFEEQEELSKLRVSDFVISVPKFRASDLISAELIQFITSSDAGAALIVDDSSNDLAGIITASSLLEAMRPSMVEVAVESSSSLNQIDSQPLICADLADKALIKGGADVYRCTGQDSLATAYLLAGQAPVPIRYLPVVSDGTNEVLGLFDCEMLARIRLDILMTNSIDSNGK